MTIWIHRPDEPLLGSGDGPLVGVRVAAKDNVDVAGMPTTAACPSYSHDPTEHAPVIARLLEAGAAVVGKTNLDQFATGLVGTRSPYGAVSCPDAPELISGGSSSGSAAAVAAGEADIGIGTDTAGSGRVPAACCGVVGLKGTVGWVPNRGVVPACPSFDCTTVFARSIADGAAAMSAMAGFDEADPSSRRRPDDLTFGDVVRVGALDESALDGCTAEVRGGYRAALAAAAAAGFELVTVDLSNYFEAGALLYGGAFVAERAASFGAHLATEPPDADATVTAIIGGAAGLSATDLARDTATLADLRARAAAVWADVDAVLTPTIPEQPTIAEVDDDPIGVNSRLGRFVTGCNLVDWCAIAVPFPIGDGRPVGVQLLGPAWSDDVIWRAAARLLGEDAPPRSAPRIELAVLGAHLLGQPLHHQLSDRGASYVTTTTTAPAYRMYALDGTIAKPGLVRVSEGGGAVEVEVWSLCPAAFGSFVSEIPGPLGVGTLELADGTTVIGFLCESVAVDGALEITEHGGWRGWLASR
ncbi:MAG: allophanate hydrolase [Actinomycetota bacterium]